MIFIRYKKKNWIEKLSLIRILLRLEANIFPDKIDKISSSRTHHKIKEEIHRINFVNWICKILKEKSSKKFNSNIKTERIVLIYSISIFYFISKEIFSIIIEIDTSPIKS